MIVLKPLRSVLCACLVLFSMTASAAETLKAGVFDPPRPAPQFLLQSSRGAELRLSDYRGKVVVLGFGFTSCPDVCPTTLAVLARARQRLGSQSDQMQVVYITVDPAKDDAARLHKYLGTFDPTFVGGTGTAEQLDAVRRDYGILAQRKNVGDSYTMAHSSFVYLIDRAGKLRALMPYGHSPDDYAHDVRLLLSK